MGFLNPELQGSILIEPVVISPLCPNRKGAVGVYAKIAYTHYTERTPAEGAHIHGPLSPRALPARNLIFELLGIGVWAIIGWHPPIIAQ